MEPTTSFSENRFEALSGWLVLIGILLTEIAVIAHSVFWCDPELNPARFAIVIVSGILLLPFTLPGFFVVSPNMSRVLTLFGKYRGTVRRQGFFWTNPFTIKQKVSLKAYNVASEKIKVNDLRGNPIEIGAVVVWQVRDTAQALFDVEDYYSYVDLQIETAVRALASKRPYDDGPGDTPQGESVISLRGDTAQVADELQEALSRRLERAGIAVLEARLSHLAYAQEIASAMLQRQQAEAVIAARQKIVEGAVGMVEQALEDLGKKQLVELDSERRATLVGNLLVVLCGQATPQPVINTGGLYS